MTIIKPVISLANLWLVGPLLRSLGPATRVEVWLNDAQEPDFGWDRSDQRVL